MERSRLRHKTAIFLSFAIFLATWGLAWAAPLVLTEKDFGKTLTVAAGQMLRVDLRLGAGQHVVAPEFDPMVLTLVGQTLQSTSGPQGASSRVVYDFFVRQGGRTDLVISSKGPGGEGQAKPLLKVKIVATGGGLAI